MLRCVGEEQSPRKHQPASNGEMAPTHASLLRGERGREREREGGRVIGGDSM